jgi:glycosyltransferase involved in cell wall biosynthesis
MEQLNKLKVVFFNPVLQNVNSAGYNRFLSIVKMVSFHFNYKILNPKYKIKYNNKIIRGLLYRLYIIQATFNIIRKRKKGNIIIFYLFGIDPILSLFFGFFSKIANFKIICEVNEFPKSIIKDNKTLIYINKLLIYPWLFNLNHGYSLISDELITFFSKYSSQSIINKLPMTVDFERFIIKTKDNFINYIFYAGSLSQEKDGIIHLLNAFSKFHEITNDISLVICGDGSEQDKELFLNTIKQLEISNNVKYLGLIDRNEIPGLVLNAMICVLPRPNSVQAQAGFPTKLGEYLASGKPVIVTDVGDIPKYLKNDEAYIISNKNIEAELYAAFIEIKTDYNKALKIGMKGKERAKQEFSLDNNALKIKKFIHQVSGV